MVPAPNIVMQSINESSIESQGSSGKPGKGKLKSAFGMFKKKNKVSGSESVSSDGSFIHRMKFNRRKSSLSLSDADEDDDDENMLVDKFGFIINVESFDRTVSICSEDEKTASLRESFSSLAVDPAPEKSSKNKKEWVSLLGLDSTIRKNKGTYESLVFKAQTNDNDDDPELKELKTTWDSIERDLRRTFPKHSMFREQSEDKKVEEPKGEESNESVEDADAAVPKREEPIGKQALRRILRSYSLYDKEVGYCQGMNFVAGMLLTFMSEEEAFWLLVVIMNNEPYKLREIFSKDMNGTHEILYIADKLVHSFLPQLYEHLEKNTVHTSMFCTQWLMTIYTSTFPFDLVSMVWDAFLSEGWKIVYKTCIALLMHASDDGKLLDKNMEEILSYLRHFQAEVNGAEIINAANKVPLKQRHIQKHATDFRKMMESGELQVHEVIQRFLSNDDCSTIITNNSHSSSKVLRFIKLKRVKNTTVRDFSPKLVPIAYEAKLCVLISNALTPEECEELMRRGKETGYDEVLIRSEGMKSTKHIAKCHRAEVKDFDLAEELFQCIMGALEGIPELLEKFEEVPWMRKKVDIPLRATSVNDSLHFLRFGVGDSFMPLKDNMVKRGNEASCCTMHVYLNDGFKGGVTSFKGERGDKFFDVNPKAGSILIFDQDLKHEECEVTKGKRHFIRSDILYSPVQVNGSSA